MGLGLGLAGPECGSFCPMASGHLALPVRPCPPTPPPRGALSLGRSGRLLTWAQSVINSLFSPSPFSGNKGALRVPSF